jgi:hypothetical protein
MEDSVHEGLSEATTFVPTAFFSRLSDVFGPSTHHTVHYPESRAPSFVIRTNSTGMF